MNALAVWRGNQTYALVSRSHVARVVGGSLLFRAAYTLWDFLVQVPAEHLYFRGYWRNIPEQDICAAVTHFDSGFWLQNQDACLEVIANDLDSWMVWGQVVGVWALALLCLCRCCRSK